MRVHEYAKANNVKSATVLQIAATHGLQLSTASSGIGDNDLTILDGHFRPFEAKNETPEPSLDAENSDDGHAETVEPVTRKPIGLMRPHRYAKRRKIHRSAVLAVMRKLKITPVDRHRPLSQEDVDALDDYFEIPA